MLPSEIEGVEFVRCGVNNWGVGPNRGVWATSVLRRYRVGITSVRISVVATGIVPLTDGAPHGRVTQRVFRKAMKSWTSAVGPRARPRRQNQPQFLETCVT